MDKEKIVESIDFLKEKLSYDQIRQIANFMATDVDWYKPMHAGVGMGITIRNTLRVGGFTEAAVGLPSWETPLKVNGEVVPAFIFVLNKALK